MTKKKVNRVSNTRRPRVPNEHVRLELIIPQSTCDRIVDHCARNNMKGEDFYKKAIYDALPVHYEVTEEFVFPFGKYAGETAGVVKRIDPSYIEWCKKSITGFYDNMEPVNAQTDSSVDARVKAYDDAFQNIQNQLKHDEHLVGGAVTREGKRMWAKQRFTGRYRFLGFLPPV